jgi:hypothetical protein
MGARPGRFVCRSKRPSSRAAVWIRSLSNCVFKYQFICPPPVFSHTFWNGPKYSTTSLRLVSVCLLACLANCVRVADGVDDGKALIVIVNGISLEHSHGPPETDSLALPNVPSKVRNNLGSREWLSTSWVRSLVVNDLSRALEYLIDRGELRRSAAFGVAKKIIRSGTASLSPGQRQIYQRFIAPKLDLSCTRCGKAISIGEVVGAYENEGMCGWCLVNAE